MIWLPIVIYSDKVQFCAGNLLYDPTSGVSAQLVQLEEKASEINALWLALLIGFWCIFYCLCCTSFCVIAGAAAKMQM